jgi:phospholipid/cholesterol/gamma-HCH transport system substrate-binding protein
MGRQLRDTLVGVFLVVGIIIFIVLYTWLSGRIGFRNTYELTIYFDDVAGLRVGDPVMVYGLEKGRIKSLGITGDSVKTVIALDRDIIVPEDSKIAIRAVSYLGGDKYIKISPGISSDASTTFHGINETLELESLAQEFDGVISKIESFKLPDLDKALVQLSRDIDQNIQALAEMVKGPSDKLEKLIVRLDSLSMLFEGEGTVGKLLKSDDLYEELRETNSALKALIEDIKENPQKYINIKVF